MPRSFVLAMSVMAGASALVGGWALDVNAQQPLGPQPREAPSTPGQDLATALESRIAEREARQDALERRIEAIERRLEALVEMLERETGRAADPVEVEGPAQAAGFAPGLRLDVHALPEDADDALPETPSGVRIGTLADLEAPRLAYDAFAREPGLTATARTATIGLAWSGVIAIEEAGEHVLAAELATAPDAGFDACALRVGLGGTPVLALDLDADDGRRSAEDRQGFPLEPGIYDLSTWLVCAPTEGAARRHDRVSVELRMQAPAGGALAPIAAGRLGHDQ